MPRPLTSSSPGGLPLRPSSTSSRLPLCLTSSFHPVFVRADEHAEVAMGGFVSLLATSEDSAPTRRPRRYVLPGATRGYGRLFQTAPQQLFRALSSHPHHRTPTSFPAAYTRSIGDRDRRERHPAQRSVTSTCSGASTPNASCGVCPFTRWTLLLFNRTTTTTTFGKVRVAIRAKL